VVGTFETRSQQPGQASSSSCAFGRCSSSEAWGAPVAEKAPSSGNARRVRRRFWGRPASVYLCLHPGFEFRNAEFPHPALPVPNRISGQFSPARKVEKRPARYREKGRRTVRVDVRLEYCRCNSETLHGLPTSEDFKGEFSSFSHGRAKGSIRSFTDAVPVRF
jgi:hypothetical protein